MKKIIKNILISSILMVSLNSFAQNSLESTLNQYKIVIKNNKEVLEDVNKVMPSDTIEYVAKYKNVSSNEISNLNISLPIPNGMYLNENSPLLILNGKSYNTYKVTIDNKNYFSYPIDVKVIKNGKEINENAHILSYKAISAKVDKLAPGKEVLFKARMTVIPVGETGKKMEQEYKIQQDIIKK